MDFKKLLQRKEIYSEDLFQLEESNLLLSKLQPHLEELQNKGICFDFTEVKDHDKEYIAIDCDQFVKFILKSKFDREKDIEIILFELSKKTENQESIDWLDRIYRFHLYENEYYKSEIEHIIDWMNSFRDENKSVISLKLTYQDAVTKSLEWTELLNRKGAKSPGKVEVVMSFDDGSYVCRLLDNEARKWEGYHMSHCVSDDNYKGHSGLYSLRDSSNFPHVTIEIDGNYISQIKGKGNGKVNPKYIELVIRFLSSLNIQINEDEMENIGYSNILTEDKYKLENVFSGCSFFSLKDQTFLYKGSKCELKEKANCPKIDDELFCNMIKVISVSDLEFLIKNSLVNIHANYDYAIQYASQECSEEIVKLLLEHGANVHAGGGFAIKYASVDNRLEVVKLLLQYGADAYSVTNDLIRWAKIAQGNDEVIRILLKHGANVHANNDSALKWASGKGKVENVKILLEYGANVSAENNLALKEASENGYLEVVNLLLKHGADVHAEDDYALRYAKKNGHLEIVKFLLEHGASKKYA